MDIYKKIVDIADNNEEIKLTENFRSLLHTHLVFGHTRHVVRYGVLGQGHEHVTDAQRYYQLHHEMWNYANAIKHEKANARIAQADLLDAERELRRAWRKSTKLRAQAKKELAESRLINCLCMAEDYSRQLDEFNKIRLELQPSVEAKYPNGIEQAQPDIWKDRAMLRIATQSREVSSIPLDNATKAELGTKFGIMSLLVPESQVSPEKSIKRLKSYGKNTKSTPRIPATN